MDSCVSAAVAIQEGFEPAFLHVNYGQLTQAAELRAFEAIATYYKVRRRLVIDLDYLRKIGGSALTDPTLPLPEGDLDRPGIPTSYVPFRNANLLSKATSWSETLSARQIYIGAVEEDGSGYPDCREVFFHAFNRAIREGTKPDTQIRIVTPLIHLTKKDIVALGLKLGVPFDLTWTCYRENDVACGSCDSCLLRLRGFHEAGAVDPIPYRSNQSDADRR